jgi:hypothetical protein
MTMKKAAPGRAAHHEDSTDNSTIRAIPTRYKGYHFRSRIEARWAVLFDGMGLEWDYEPEGFDLPSGRYLPDFRIFFHGRDRTAGYGKHPLGLWVEVKGGFPSERERNLAEDLFWVTRTPVAVVSELRTCRVECHPWRCNCAQALRMPGTGSDEATDTWLALPAWLPRGAEAFLSAGGHCRQPHGYGGCRLTRPLSGHLSLWSGGGHPGQGIQQAVDAARSARFEHGHSGAS